MSLVKKILPFFAGCLLFSCKTAEVEPLTPQQIFFVAVSKVEEYAKTDALSKTDIKYIRGSQAKIEEILKKYESIDDRPRDPAVFDVYRAMQKNSAVFSREYTYQFGNIAKTYLSLAFGLLKPNSKRQCLAIFVKADRNKDKIIDPYEAKDLYRASLSRQK
ncbi:hypothetical protein KY346_04275 [Candidatus Woesearchaeota archaeon]|nr:hypothetical protein [Candidatus Woesearchaeota archaeon]